MNQTLAGKTAFITGGGGSIGLATAKRLAEDGAAVFLMGRGKETLEKARDAVLKHAPTAKVGIFAGDACVEAEVEAAAKAAHGMLGRLDILVPTVGGGGGFKPILLNDVDSFRESMDRNLVSAFIAAKACVPLMEHGGAIVFLSATSAKLGIAWLSAGAAAKSGIEGFMRSAAEEFGEANIRCNAVRPGLTVGGNAALMAPEVKQAYMEQCPLAKAQNRVGRPEDIAQAIRFLAGPESSWITGQSIAVDGGNELRRNPDLVDMVAKTYGKPAMAAVRRGRKP